MRMISPKSCDTLVAYLKNDKGEKITIFAKNSDRPDDEAQLVTYFPAKRYPKGKKLKTTYLTIPQVERTNAAILSKPYWMWGAEMGVNEYGVAIGNEAVWTTQKLRHKGLTGMDLVRLGLERGKTAREAMDLMIELLIKYHQGGFCDADGTMLYHNSFIIADPDEAWVLETADDFWVAERVEEGVRNISNELSITNLGHHRPPGIVEWAMKMGRCTGKEDFNFAKIFSSEHWDESFLNFGRYAGVKKQLEALERDWNEGVISSRADVILRVMDILRDHEHGICMHGDTISAGSQISILDKDLPVHWFTITPHPCRSLYLPFTFSSRCKGSFTKECFHQVEDHWEWSKGGYSEEHLKEVDLNELQREIVMKVEEHVNRIRSGEEDPESLRDAIKRFNEEAYEIHTP